MRRHVFITGGTGYMGRALIPELLTRRHAIRALVRPGSEARLAPGCERVLGNALDGRTFADAIAPGDTLVHLIGTPHPSPAKARQFREIDLASVREMLAPAERAGVAHVVFVSVAHPGPIMHAYIAARSEAEDMIRPLQAGRSFDVLDRLSDAEIDDHDAWRGTGVAIVSEAFARREWPEGDALGRYLQVDFAEYRSVRVIGIAGDVRTEPGVPPHPTIYLPNGQSPRGDLTFFVRGSTDPTSLAVAVRERLRAFGVVVAAFNIRSLAEIQTTALARPRFSGAVMSWLGIAGVLLTAAGLNSLLSFLVSQRSRELAVRIALGAAERDIMRLIVGRGLRLTVAGIVAGTAGAVWASRLLRSILPQVQAWDSVVVAVIAALVLAVACIASYLPARKAAGIDPIAALRHV
jgi:NAD(P)-dependent dehydrogenase (short-subunit alcohol dehydrogenase family)